MTTSTPAPAAGSLVRGIGLVLFLPVPVVLALFTRAPLGVGRSLALGLLLMATHVLYARAFALRHAARRCLWCGGTAAADGPSLAVVEPLGDTTWRCCSAAHATLLTRFLRWTEDHSARLRVGILGTLVLFLPLALLADRGSLGVVQFEDAVAGFRLAIALSVLPLGWLATRSERSSSAKPRLPFPLHIQSLIGTLAVMWLFRLIGVLWLVQALAHLAQRFCC